MSRPPKKIGGSDIPKLLGLSPYGGPFEVYQRVALGIETPWNPKMERGAAVEPTLRSIGQSQFGFEIVERESDYHPHPEYEWATAQVDDVVAWKGRKVAVDYKSTNRWAKGFGREGTDEVPEHMRAQFAWEMCCSNLDELVALVGFGEDAPPPEIFVLTKVVSYVIPRCLLFEAHCLAVAKRFYEEHVLAGVPPLKTQTGKKRKAS